MSQWILSYFVVEVIQLSLPKKRNMRNNTGIQNTLILFTVHYLTKPCYVLYIYLRYF